MYPISILVSEANLLVRKGLQVLLTEHEELEVVGKAESLQELQLLVEKLQPRVVTIDCGQADIFSASVVQAFREEYPQTNWLVITAEKDKDCILDALRCGVCSYILKDCGAQEIVNAVFATARGDKYMCSNVLEVLFSEPKPLKAEAEAEALTARETEIIQLIAAGNSTMQIADMLHLSYHTINSHRKNILRKLQIKSPAELILKALDLKIIKMK
ncbi:response regulator transcription factor [Pontibacter qinzhouensis]|uniref:Response regulator transcription factor n=1 Tax=Pontibacter qinzhouensis TaxID=2603253 RepID=A0A5C8K943_9BACT|nr:response regulator transcription factor [Pontibacter qinzhouensis]TXK50498.1 response regulator transcription factor [Pontibacter qinzhouensis]